MTAPLVTLSLFLVLPCILGGAIVLAVEWLTFNDPQGCTSIKLPLKDIKKLEEKNLVEIRRFGVSTKSGREIIAIKVSLLDFLAIRRILKDRKKQQSKSSPEIEKLMKALEEDE